MRRCCEGSDSEEESLLDPSSHRRSYREIDGRRRESTGLRQSSSRAGTSAREQTAVKNSVLDGAYGGIIGSIGLTPVDNPYSPQQLNLRTAGIYSVSLPPNLCGACISTVLNLGDCTLLWVRDVPVFLTTFISMLLQSSLTFYIVWQQFDNTVEVGSCGLGGWQPVRAICIIVFSMHMLSEVTEVLDMHFWLHIFRYSHRHLPMEVREYEDKFGQIVYKPVTGVTYLARFLLYLLVLLPKLLMVVGLLVFGIPYIAYGQRNEDLITNTVAMFFVAEIDEIVFRFSIAKIYRDTLIMPALGRTEEEKTRCFEMIVCGSLRSYVLHFLLAIFVSLLYLFWCQV